jgi:hypothetical protein
MQINDDVQAPIIDGKYWCLKCNNAKSEQDISLGIPENIVFVSKVAKMGKQRVICLPKKQLPFLETNRDYIIIIKKLN